MDNDEIHQQAMNKVAVIAAGLVLSLTPVKSVEARGCLKGWIQITPTSNFCVPIKEEDKAVYDACFRENRNKNAAYTCMKHNAPHMFNY